MQVKYHDVELLALVPHKFTDKEGIEVEYNECYFETKDDEGISSVMVFNTKLPLASKVRERGILSVEVDSKGLNKPRATNFEVE
jgi:hypothetical protein